MYIYIYEMTLYIYIFIYDMTLYIYVLYIYYQVADYTQLRSLTLDIHSPKDLASCSMASGIGRSQITAQGTLRSCFEGTFDIEGSILPSN